MNKPDCKTQKMVNLLIKSKTLPELEAMQKEYSDAASVLRLLGVPADDETQDKRDNLFFVEHCVRIAVKYLKNMPKA